MAWFIAAPYAGKKLPPLEQFVEGKAKAKPMRQQTPAEMKHVLSRWVAATAYRTEQRPKRRARRKPST